ncbi:MAG TPA: pyruvate, phosphate dikinase, partial [Thermoanaerobaculia bacterium]|nr:pyruvate, phosphate dikinase [Thermoanaerobaculia bacterium]
MPAKYVYAFGGGSADGDGSQKLLLGGKGAGLAEMSRIGTPVPPGFTITTEVCTFYQQNDGSYPQSLKQEVAQHLAKLEEYAGKRFGDPENPLLVSVRSGAARSMPGMMDTILNLGLSDAIVEAWIARGADARFVLDAYRRLLTMYGDVVLNVPHEEFEKNLTEGRRSCGAKNDAELTPEALRKVVEMDLRLIEERAGQPFPQDPQEQLWGSVGAVFGSWNNPRARDYRRIEGISESLGTAVNVQTMVFGNQGADCATGVAFTRNPATGEKKVFGEYLVNAQGEDVVAGIRTPRTIERREGHGGLGQDFPEAHRQLEEICATLEKHFRDMQDVEFTIQHGTLFMLQTRAGKRTGRAAVCVAVDMVEEGLIEPREALERVQPEQLSQLLAPEFDLNEKKKAVDEGRLLAGGLAAGPGAASGRIALTAERAAEMAATCPVLLVRAETSPDDIVGMHASAGILTSRGGMTSHAAVVARGMGKPCVAGAGELRVSYAEQAVHVNGTTIKKGDWVTLDGSTGEVFGGQMPTVQPELSGDFAELMSWADEFRKLGVRANADIPRDAEVARRFGAEGIGLCRTEHMFFEGDRIDAVREMIIADTEEDRRAALAKIEPLQQGDFEGLFREMAGLPVTIRTLDPPLHEFLPHEDSEIEALAAKLGVDAAKVKGRVESLREANPMLGFRGCRLGIIYPEITEMQANAIFKAAVAVKAEGIDVHPEVMIPLVGNITELKIQEELVRKVAGEVFAAA